jgi:hypothetical protein
MPFIGNKPSAVPLTSADIADGIITSAKITDATIANADIANSTIDLTTKVTGTLPTSKGGTGLAALGTSLQVLRTNTGATALEFATPASGSFTFLGETTASNVATVDLNGYFTSDYDYYQIYIDGLYSSSNLADLNMRFSTTGSYTVQTTTYYSNVVFAAADAGDTLTNGQQNAVNAGSFMILPNLSSTSTQVSSSLITLYDPMGSNVKIFTTLFTGAYSNIGTTKSGSGGGRWNNTTAITGVRFFTSSGNIYARKIKIYGVKNS